MRRAIHSAMIVLMVLWTAIVVVDLVQSLFTSSEIIGVVANETAADRARRFAQSLWHDFWGIKAQARAIVWGIPMIVFALVTALTQR